MAIIALNPKYTDRLGVGVTTNTVKPSIVVFSPRFGVALVAVDLLVGWLF
jgi:hypothetical protein